jgi:hypothetical protein
LAVPLIRFPHSRQLATDSFGSDAKRATLLKAYIGKLGMYFTPAA